MPLKTCTPSDVTPLTRPDAVSTTGEPVAVYLKAGRLRQAWIDFLAIPSLADRLATGLDGDVVKSPSREIQNENSVSLPSYFSAQI